MQELGLEANLKTRCIIEAELVDIAKKSISNFDFTDLNKGVIHTDKGDICQHSCPLDQFETPKDNPFNYYEIFDKDWQILTTTHHWLDNKIRNKYIYIYPQIPSFQKQKYNPYQLENIYRKQSIEFLKGLIKNYTFKDSDYPSIQYDWGEIYVQKIKKPSVGVGGFIVIRFNGDIKDWFNNYTKEE
jgi:hypothetical protein